MNIANDPITPGFTFPTLTATVTENIGGKHPLKCVLDTVPCPHLGCTGLVHNTMLYERIISNKERPPYPESVTKVILEKEAEARENDGYVIYKGCEVKLDTYIRDMEFVAPDETGWDEAIKHVNEPIGLLHDSGMNADVMECNVCNNWYVVCLDCNKPCIVKSFCGAFSEEVYNPQTKEYEDGSYVELCRKRVTLMDGTQSEFIGVHHASKHVEFKSNPPYCIVKPTKAWYSGKVANSGEDSVSEESESEEESYDDEDWRFWYECEEKGVIWARDPRLNLFIGHCKYTPILCGPDGGFPILYSCISCNKEYTFTDK